jgi:integrase/recombinase XerD
MARERLIVKTDRFFSKIAHHTDLEVASHPPDHTPLQVVDQLQNRFNQTESSVKRDGHRGDKRGRFEDVVLKLGAKDVPGKEYVESYLRAQYRRNLRVSSIGNSLRAITNFLTLVKLDGHDYIEQISRADIEGYIEHEQDRGLKASTVKHGLDMLKAFVRYLIEEQIVSSDILFRRMIIKVPEALPKAIEIEDEKQLICAIDDVRNLAMILLLLRTGMRIGELLDTRAQDIDMKEQKIQIWEAAKNRMGRVVYFTEDAKEALVAWIDMRDHSRECVFYASGRHRLTYGAARAMFCKYKAKAGLSHKSYTLHCLRHTYASSLLNAGMPLECLKELLGHQSVEVTRRYARLTNKTREREYFTAMEKIEKGEIDGYYKLDLELQKILEKKELLTPNGEKLHE